jgi:hypothetical protein
VIKLTKLLLEDKRNSHCWISPRGRIIPVDSSHDFTARKISPGPSSHDAMMDLWKKSYLRVTYMYDGSLLVHNEVMMPNDIQMKQLMKIAAEGEHDKIVFDSGDNERILWSVNDTLQ